MLVFLQELTIWPIIGLILFFVAFILIVLWAVKMDKKTVQYLENMPVANQENSDH